MPRYDAPDGSRGLALSNFAAALRRAADEAAAATFSSVFPAAARAVAALRIFAWPRLEICYRRISRNAICGGIYMNPECAVLRLLGSFLGDSFCRVLRNIHNPISVSDGRDANENGIALSDENTSKYKIKRLSLRHVGNPRKLTHNFSVPN